MSTIFEKIIAGQSPCHKIAETKHALAFLDIRPMSKGHTLVIPKRHSLDLLAIEQQDLFAVMDLAQQVAKRQMTVLSADGITVRQHNRKAGGQDVFHFHVHVIPRWNNQKLNHPAPLASQQELASLALLLQF